MNKLKKMQMTTRPWIHVFFVIVSLASILPFVIVISASFSSSRSLTLEGFSLFPRDFDVGGYKYLFENPRMLVDAYAVTIFITVVTTIAGTLLSSMGGFAIARLHRISPLTKSILSWIIYFPGLFNGGMVAGYIINTQYLHLYDNLAVLILPSLVSTWHMFLLRTFIMNLPSSLFEAAKIDGAGEYDLYVKVAMPLCKPSLATVAFMKALAAWNIWYPCLLYIEDEKKYTLQYLLQRMLKSIQALKDEMVNVPSSMVGQEIPGENLRMAMLIIAIGPIVILFPFFQKYFTKGIVAGAVKG